MPALRETKKMTSLTFAIIGKMVMGHLSPKTISGPIGIAKGAGITAKIGFAYYLGFLALVSISLGVLNILPIPVLDGGHLLYYLFEIVRGRPLSEKAQTIGLKIGLFLLLSLMMFAIYNDITKFFVT